MRTVTWETDDGYTIQLGAEPPFLFKELKDNLGATAEVVKPPRFDGQRTYHVALASRIINITGSMVAYGNKQLDAQIVFDRHRSHLSQAFSPNRWGYLTYHSAAGNRRIYCRPLATPTFGSRVGITCTLDIEFTSDSPYWESSDEHVYTVGKKMKLWHFPMTFNRIVFGARPKTALLRNPTGEIIYPTIEVTSTAQLVTVSNQTIEKEISINRPITEGQKMVIHTEDASATIWTKEEGGGYRQTEEASHWLTLDSEPWGLVPGENIVTISNEVAEETPITYIKYRHPFLGV